MRESITSNTWWYDTYNKYNHSDPDNKGYGTYNHSGLNYPLNIDGTENYVIQLNRHQAGSTGTYNVLTLDNNHNIQRDINNCSYRTGAPVICSNSHYPRVNNRRFCGQNIKPCGNN